MSEVTDLAAKATAEAKAAEVAAQAEADKSIAAVEAVARQSIATAKADEVKAVAFWNQYRVFAIVAAVIAVGVIAFVASLL